jgi:hypothetical protein
MVGLFYMDDMLFFFLIGVIFLFATAAVLEFMSFLGYRNTPEACAGSHKWGYDDDGELVCSVCKRKAKDILS